ncbi:hypothetical protein [Acidianus bottle-shaped virus 3 strain ABV3]|uniref:Uncharacterized protein n=1 Tax=Acidianus bottle-shaped virus 3 strain ABV3 TaxID=1732174 RepID=A0A0N7FYX2_9VIRU|nr:hypothetical protein AVU00_gp10 [Acidianus bottle-shaped virus 3 strain ABV3]ALG96812.1 hypothetical protein [Acidianus bottle-shaped virus 3 strain ABV3]
MPRGKPNLEPDQVMCPNKYTSRLVEYCLLYRTNLNVFEGMGRYEKGYVVYHVYPGITYLKFNVMKKLTKTAPYFLTISKFEIIPSTFTIEDEPLLTAEIPPEWYEKILEDPNAPPLLKAVLEAFPKEKDEYAYIPSSEYFEGYWKDQVEEIKRYLESLNGEEA